MTPRTTPTTPTFVAAGPPPAADARARALAEATDDVLWERDLATDLAVTSDAMRTVFGHPVGAFTSAWWRAHVHPDDLARVLAQLDAQRAVGDRWRLEYRFRDGAGAWRHVLDRGTVLRDGEGRAARLVGAMADVTDTVRAVEADLRLRTSEARLRRIADSGVVGIVFWHEDGAILDANDAFLALVGYTRDDLRAGRVDWKALTPPEWAHTDERALREIGERGITSPWEKEYERPDGRRVPVLLAAAALGEMPGHGVTIITDLTLRKRAAERARRLQAITARLAAALTPEEVAAAVLTDGAAALGADHGLVAVREGGEPAGGATENPTGRARSGMLALLGAQWLPPAVSRDWLRFPLDAPAPLAAAARTGASYFVHDRAQVAAEWPALTGEFAAMGAHATCVLPLAVHGRPLGALAFVYAEPRTWDDEERTFLDSLAAITAQALERARLVDAMRASDERLRLALAAGRVGTYDWDLVTGALRWDERMPALFGRAQPRDVEDAVSTMWPEDAPVLEAAIARALDPASDGAYHCEYRIVRPDREGADAVRWLESHGRVFFEGEGDARRGVRFLGTVVDVTERRAGEAERERLLATEQRLRAEAEAASRRADEARAEAEAARRRAEEASRAKSEFLANMSHELRTPLNAIQGHVQLLELELHGPITAPQREALGRVQRAQQHLLALINDVLNFARIEAGRIEYAPRAVDVGALLLEVAALVEPQFAAKRLRLAIEEAGDAVGTPGSGTPAAWADPEKVAQIALNLLGNAAKFTPAEGAVTVTIAGGAGVVCVAVADTGAGIAPEMHAAIFEPFVQVHAGRARPHEGTGLGLAISRDLARGMGGDLTVESAPGAGATFRLTLPAA